MMNYTGLYTSYKINRPLTDKEKYTQYHQGQRRNVSFVTDENFIVRMNSTYLELVDKFYEGKGIVGSLFIPVFFVVSAWDLFFFF